MKKNNMALWGAVLFLLGLCLTAAATGESEPVVGAALACTSTLAVSASFLLNLYGVKQNMANHRVILVMIGLLLSLVNTFAYIYSLIAGLAKVSLYSNGWALLLFLFAVIIPAALAFRMAIKDGMPSTKDKAKR